MVVATWCERDPVQIPALSVDFHRASTNQTRDFVASTTNKHDLGVIFKWGNYD